MYDDDDRVNTQLTMMGYLVTVLHTPIFTAIHIIYIDAAVLLSLPSLSSVSSAVSGKKEMPLCKCL